MARKKSISISRKPSAEAITSIGSPATDLPERSAQHLEPVEIAPVPAKPSINPLAWVIYGPVFCASYGVVFSAILLGSLIPGSGLVGRALCDGSDAARRNFD